MAKTKSSSKAKRPSKPDPIDQVGPVATSLASEQPAPRLPFPVVGLGASAGGLQAVGKFFEAMSPDSGMAFVLIQHLAPDHKSMLAEILSRWTKMPVLEVRNGMRIKRDHVYVIRPDKTLTIRNSALHLGELLEKPGHRCPVDDFFRSLAEVQRERAIGIVMSGMGSNGTAGARAVKAAGGLCIAQDPASAQFPAMARSLMDAGLADFVLRPEEMPKVILRYSKHPYTQGSGEETGLDAQALNEILATLHARFRHDFNGYKKSTLVRRIQRRMGLCQITDMSDYARVLQQTQQEVSALANDLMIHVTAFFRDRESWDALRKTVIVPLVAERMGGASIRAWVTACATGEEAYTLAILLVEAAEAAGKDYDIQIFATDVAERALFQARNGVYPAGIESEISPERLERFFDKGEASYRIKKKIRERVVFAAQNILQDPPFSRLDICTCRNLLIYLEPEVQRHLLVLMHFGLREDGALFLGSSETTSGAEVLFEPIDKKHRIFRRLGPTRPTKIEFSLPHALTLLPESEHREPYSSKHASIAQLANAALMQRHSLPAVVIDRQHWVVYFHGDTLPYLHHPPGEPTRDLLLLARESLRGAVRTALRKAMAQNAQVTGQNGVIESAEGPRRIEVTVAPLDQRMPPAYFLVMFNERPEIASPAPAAGSATEDRPELLEALRRARDDLQSMADELQASKDVTKASNEQATSVNEELQSSNEELQSSNEELQTSKEELQSLNEELTTVNFQLQAKMEELERATTDLNGLLSSTDIAVVFLDTQFCIRLFTPALKDLFDVIPSDLGRPLTDLARKFKDDELLADAQVVLDKAVRVEKEIVSKSGRMYVRRILPYRAADASIKGVVVTFIDIGERRQAETALRESKEQYRLIFDNLKDYRLIFDNLRDYAIFILDREGRIASWNFGAERVLKFTQSEAIGQPLSLIFCPEDRKAGVPTKELEQAQKQKSITQEGWRVRKDGIKFWGVGTLTTVLDDTGQLCGYVKILHDNTDKKLNEEALKQASRIAEEANKAKDNFLANVSHELRTPLGAIVLWINLLEEEGTPVAPRVRETLNAIRKCADEQGKLIEDLVDTSRIVAGKFRLDFREIPLNTVVQAAIESVRPNAIEKGLKIEETLDPRIGTVNADPSRVQQVIWNLLNNAVKFTPTGGSVRVEMRRYDKNVEIRITDTGQGISKEYLPYIFERFGQADQFAGGNNNGLGLGLSIAKQIVEMHGGTISAESDGLQQGATFIVWLPLPAIAASGAVVIERPSKTKIAKALVGQHVLLIEDAKQTRDALTAVLQRAKAEVTAVGSAKAALDAFGQHRPDLIISDIGLPDIDGYKLITQIRSIERSSNIPSVPALALTAFAGKNVCSKALKSGFQLCLTKPIHARDLISTLVSLQEPVQKNTNKRLGSVLTTDEH